MQRQIGERFEYCKLILEVQEGYNCDKCFFGHIDDSEFVCLAYFNHVPLGSCNGESRTDGKDVHYIKVGEVNDDIQNN